MIIEYIKNRKSTYMEVEAKERLLSANTAPPSPISKVIKKKQYHKHPIRS